MVPSEAKSRYQNFDHKEANNSLSPERRKFFKESHISMSGDEPRVDSSLSNKVHQPHVNVPRIAADSSLAFKMRNGQWRQSESNGTYCSS